MIKLAKMKEKIISMEKLLYNQEVKEIGAVLAQISRLEKATEIETAHGHFVRVGELRTQIDISPRYQHKKHLFKGKIQDQPVVILHFSGEVYGQDQNYFRRIYEDSRDIFSGQATQFTERKITPSLLGADDKTMTLVIEKAPRDLSFYFSSSDEKKIKQVLKGALNLMKHTWDTSKRESEQFPRYVGAFLEPEYAFLKERKPEDYLKDPKVIDFYKQTQAALKEYLDQLKQTPFERGFGFGDVKPSNLVEDEKGNVLFIDVGKPGFNHWLTMLGQVYQATVREAPNSLFSKTLKEEINQTISSNPQPELAIKLFALGRMNRLLIGCTLRNIVFTAETGSPVDENRIRDLLAKVRQLTKITSKEQVIKYASDEFDSWWRERLKDYPQSPKYESNLQKLKKEFDKTLPKEKPERKLVFVFMGIPGSGKSVIAQIIRKIHPSVILRSDWIFFEKLKDQIEDDYYKAYVYQEDLARRYLKDGYSVIMDDNNRTVKNRTEVYKWARECGVEPVLIVIDVDLEVAVDRVTLKGKEIETREEKLAGLRAFESQVEKPSPKEQVKIIRINGNLPLEKIESQLEKEIRNL